MASAPSGQILDVAAAGHRKNAESRQSVSPSSSLSSFASGGSMLRPAPPSNSSQSEILATSSEYSYSVSSSPRSEGKLSNTSPHHLLPEFQDPPITSSFTGHRVPQVLHADMGQPISRPTLQSQQDQLPPPSKPNAFPGVVSTGLKLKRAFAHRRKGSSSAASVLADNPVSRETLSDSDTLSGSDTPHLPKKPKQLKIGLSSAMHALTGRKGSQSADIPTAPPLPPPKPNDIRIPAAYKPQTRDRSSFLVSSPGISAAIAYMNSEQLAYDTESPSAAAPPVGKSEQEEWKKSDSQSTSPHTARSGSQGTRTPRPLSFAESLNSTHTIVPTTRSHRLSALVTDAEYATPEEETTPTIPDFNDDALRSLAVSEPTSPSPRRSLSLNLASFAKGKRSLPALPTDTQHATGLISQNVNPGGFVDERPKSPFSSQDSSTRATTNGVRAPLANTTTNQVDAIIRSQPGSQVIKTFPIHVSDHASSSPPVAHARALQSSYTTPTFSQPQPRRNSQSYFPPSTGIILQPSPTPSLRQTAISMTSGLAPAAGLAMGFGKRAMERVGRAWGSTSSHSSNHSSSSIASQVTSNAVGVYQGQDFFPGHQFPLHPSGAPRRTPGANSSGTWSISSHGTGSSASDTDNNITTTGVGLCLREPLRRAGVVFGRSLVDCARETAVSTPNIRRQSHKWNGNVGMDMEIVGSAKALDGRLLPALVVRCVQHLEKWGMEEEGLFRISGRTSHINRLRTCFDTGADFDLNGCGPEELDVHAVASVFKAYLRELPEPILTRALIPSFDAAMAADDSSHRPGHQLHPSDVDNNGPTFPSAGIAQPVLRKPPSLSTFALPSFSQLRPFSNELLESVATLLARLPPENHDLLRTVTEVIRATAKESKKTKMPLSNLLLVFCPSLSMSPPLLRLLCEGDGLWSRPNVERQEEEGEVIYIQSQPTKLHDGVARELLPSVTYSLEEEQQCRGLEGSGDLSAQPLQDAVSSRGSLLTVAPEDGPLGVPGHVGRPRSHTDSIMRPVSGSQSDAASFVSAQEFQAGVSTPAESAFDPPTDLVGTSSAKVDDSFSTARAPTLGKLKIDEDVKSTTSAPTVPFPVTPATPSSLRSRLSLSLSSPNLLRSPRTSKPSLPSVLRKLSVPSLSNNFSSGSNASSDVSRSNETTEFATPNTAPILDLAIDSSSIFGDSWVGDNSDEARNEVIRRSPSPSDLSMTRDELHPHDIPRSHTPIADLFLSSTADSSRPPSPSEPRRAESYHPLGDATRAADEDWATSVLLAASVEPSSASALS